MSPAESKGQLGRVAPTGLESVAVSGTTTCDWGAELRVGDGAMSGNPGKDSWLKPIEDSSGPDH